MQKRLPEFADSRELERYTGGDYCEKKNLVCYASQKTGGVVCRELSSGKMRLIKACGGEENPRFSPDGSGLLFLGAGKNGGRQLFWYAFDTGETRQLTHRKGIVCDPVWSPDGTKILFQMSAGGIEQAVGDEPVVIEDFGYKFDGVGFIRPDSHSQLFMIYVADGTEVQLTDGPFDHLHGNWSPDGKSVVCVSDRFRSRQESIGFDLLLLDASEKPGEIKMRTEGYWIVSYPNPVRPVFTPDGAGIIAGVLDPGRLALPDGEGYPEIYFYRFDAATGEGKKVFEGDETCYQCVQFPYNAGCGWGMDKAQIDEDGRYVYFVSGWQGQGNIYRLDLQGDGHAELLSGGKQVYHGLGRVQNKKMMVAKSEPTLPEAYYVMDVTTGELLVKAAQSAQELLDGVELAQPEDFFFETLDGESRVHGWALAPHGAVTGKKYPAILYIHGGPHPFYTYGLTMEFQCFAAAGIGVLYCNPRGSSGYGRVHQNYARSVDGSAYYDCLQFVDEAVRRFGWIDPERIGVTGGSYGGYLTNYIATHAKKFKAYVTQRSISNELISYASSDMQGESRDFVSFEDFMMDRLKASAVSYAERVDRPFLILHGTEDYRTPVEGAHQLYVALKDLHPELPVKMVLFPHTGHDQPQDPRLQEAYSREMLNWFLKYL